MEVELASNKLRALVRRSEAGELAVEDALHLFLDDDLLRLVELEITECTFTLSSVSERL